MKTKERKGTGKNKMTSERANELVNELTWSDICAGYPAQALHEALTERLEERIEIEEMEMRVILDEIAERLGQRDELKQQCLNLQHELEQLRAIDRERVKLLDQYRLGTQR